MAELDEKVQTRLSQYGLEYQVLDCDPGFADTAAFCDKYGYDLGQCANTILVAGKAEPKKFAACVVLATTRLDVNKKVCNLLGVKRASFATAAQTTDLTGMMIGGVTAFGLPNELTVYVDQNVMGAGEVIMGGGNRSSKLLLNANELAKLPGVEVVDGLAMTKAAQE